MSFVIASQVALWLAVLVLGVICIALARQVGVLHQRIAPAGALSLRQPLQARRTDAGIEPERIGRIDGEDRRCAWRPQPAAPVHLAGLHGLRDAVAGGSLGSRG